MGSAHIAIGQKWSHDLAPIFGHIMPCINTYYNVLTLEKLLSLNNMDINNLRTNQKLCYTPVIL